MHFGQLFTLVGMHLVDTTDTLLVTFCGVQDGVTGLQHATVDADEGQCAVLVVDDLERQTSELAVRVDRDDRQILGVGLFLAFRRSATDAFHVVRSRQEVDDGVEQRLNALVLEGRAAQDRTELAGNRALLDALLQGLDGDVALLEILFHGVVIDGQGCVEQVLASFLSLFLQVSRDFLVVEFRAELAAFPDDRLHLDQIDNADEVFFSADRQLQRDRNDVQLLFQRAESVVEVGARTVELVDEDDARNIVAVSKTPVGLGLRLHTGHTFNDKDCAIEHAERTVHFDVEVDVARGVDDVDAVIVPHAGHGCGRDGDAALTLLRHVIGRGVALMDLADLMRHTCVIQDTLGRRGLTRVNVRGNPDITDFREFGLG